MNICADLSNREPPRYKKNKRTIKESVCETYDLHTCWRLLLRRRGLVMAVAEGAEMECSRIATRRKGFSRGWVEGVYGEEKGKDG